MDGNLRFPEQIGCKIQEKVDGKERNTFIGPLVVTSLCTPRLFSQSTCLHSHRGFPLSQEIWALSFLSDLQPIELICFRQQRWKKQHLRKSSRADEERQDKSAECYRYPAELLVVLQADVSVSLSSFSLVSRVFYQHVHTRTLRYTNCICRLEEAVTIKHRRLCFYLGWTRLLSQMAHCDGKCNWRLPQRLADIIHLTLFLSGGRPCPLVSRNSNMPEEEDHSGQTRR